MPPQFLSDLQMKQSSHSPTGEDPFLVVELPSLKLKAPDLQSDLLQDEDALKAWVWENYQQKIRDSIQVRNESEPSELDICRKRWELIDRVAHVQQNFLKSEGPKVVYTCLLNGILELMSSEYGFIGEVRYDDDGTVFLHINATSNISLEEETLNFFRKYSSDDQLRFYNMNTLFGKVYTTQGPIISNNPRRDIVCGVPKGHPAVDSFLGLPLYGPQGDVIGMICISNKKGGYTPSDVALLEPFTATGSNLITAYKHVEDNKRLINTLEEKVKVRTRNLELANTQLEEANRQVLRTSNAQLEHFAMMSHELRTPLNCIIGMCSLLQDEEMSLSQKKSLSMVIHSGNLLLSVINDVLDFSKLESGNIVIDLQRSSLQDTLDVIMRSIQTKADSKSMRLRTFFGTNVPQYITTDNRRLQQILFNLCGNAVKFSETGSEIELHVNVEEEETSSMPEKASYQATAATTISDLRPSTGSLGCETESNDSRSKCPMHRESNSASKPTPSSRCPMSREHTIKRPLVEKTSSLGSPGCQIDSNTTTTTRGTRNEAAAVRAPTKPATRRRRSLRFVVKDYGRGIEKEKLSTIFEPFQQASADTERLYGGTGLGLSITSNLVAALGGRISVKSSIHEYSEFTVELPLEEDTPELKLESAMKNSTVSFVGIDEGDSSQLVRLFTTNGIPSESVKTFADMKTIEGQCKPHICFVNEDLYDANSCTNMALVISAGPKDCANKESERLMHFRSLSGLLPVVLIQKLTLSLRSIGESVSEETPPRPCASAAEMSRKIAALRVLIAEDNVVNQKVLSRMLKRLGLSNVHVVENGLQAVEHANNNSYEVIFMDMQMPVMDGVEACRRICRKQENSDHKSKIIFVTAHALKSFEDKCRDAGCWDYVPKPFKLPEIQACLEKAVDAA